jgi:hypothetical protein
MKRLLPVFVTFVTILSFSLSCYYDNEEALYPSIVCDSTNVTFSGQISKVLENYCLTCHSNSAASSSGNNIPLQDYADVLKKIINIEGSIKHTGPYSMMPKNAGKLPDCPIKLFDIWIRNGTPKK